MDEFPLEVIEKILAKLDDDDDLSTMLNVRLLNRKFKTAMDNMMEQKALSTWTEWKPSRFCNFLPPRLFKWFQIINSNDPERTIYTRVPKTEMFQKGAENGPLPTKSIYAYDGNSKPDWDLITAETFFSERGHGEFITSFKAHNKFPPKVMHKLLSLLPNLKGAGFPQELKAGEETFIKANPLPALPKLRYLALWNHDARNKYRDYFRWFFVAYQAHLVSLKLAGKEMVALRLKQEEGEESRPRMLPNLQTLNVYSPGGVFFKKTEATMPITHLTIEHYEKQISIKGLRVITDFVDKFAPTLIKLKLDYQLGDVSGQGSDHWPEVDYPKLTSFTVNFPSSANEETILKAAFLGRFEELVTLNFTHYHSDIFGLMVALDMNPNKDREGSLRRYFGKKLYYVNSSPTLSFISILACDQGEAEERIIIKLPWNNMGR